MCLYEECAHRHVKKAKQSGSTARDWRKLTRKTSLIRWYLICEPKHESKAVSGVVEEHSTQMEQQIHRTLSLCVPSQ